MDNGTMTKKMIRKVLIGLGVISSVVLLPAFTYAHTLQEAVAHAVLMGPDVAIQSNKRFQANYNLRQSYAGYLPTLDVSAGVGREHSDNPTTRAANNGSLTLTRRELAITARQMLFDGFAVKNDVEGKMSQVRAEAWRTNGQAQDIAAQVVQTYLNVLLEKKLVALAKYNLDAHERIFGQIEKRSEGGVGKRADLDQAEGRLALARSNLIAEQANLRDAETNYMRLVGLPAENLVQPAQPDVGFPESERVAVAMGLNNNPVLRASISDVGVTRSGKRAAQAGYFPRFDLEGSIGRNDNLDGSEGTNNDAMVMLRARWNLFNGGADVAKVNSAAYKILEAQEVRNRAYRETEQAVKLAWSVYITARNEQRYLKAHSDASERTRDAYLKQFNIGQRTLLDVLDSENELYSARVQYVRSKSDELLGKYRLLSHLGSLLDCLGVELPKAAEFKQPRLFAAD